MSFGPLGWNYIFATFQAPRILGWLLDSWKICTPPINGSGRFIGRRRVNRLYDVRSQIFVFLFTVFALRSIVYKYCAQRAIFHNITILSHAQMHPFIVLGMTVDLSEGDVSLVARLATRCLPSSGVWAFGLVTNWRRHFLRCFRSHASRYWEPDK